MRRLIPGILLVVASATAAFAAHHPAIPVHSRTALATHHAASPVHSRTAVAPAFAGHQWQWTGSLHSRGASASAGGLLPATQRYDRLRLNYESNPQRFLQNHPSLGRAIAHDLQLRISGELPGHAINGLLPNTPYINYVRWRHSLDPARFDHYHPGWGPAVERDAAIRAALAHQTPSPGSSPPTVGAVVINPILPIVASSPISVASGPRPTTPSGSTNVTPGGPAGGTPPPGFPGSNPPGPLPPAGPLPPSGPGTPPSPVPEPGGLVLMGLGLGLAGGVRAVRRRRRGTATA